MIAHTRLMVIPRSFRGLLAEGFDFSLVDNINGVVFEVNEGREPNLQFGMGVQAAYDADLPCFALMNIDLADLYGDWSNGGRFYQDLWLSLIKDKTLHGAFLRITNVTEKNGNDLPAVNIGILITDILHEWRTLSPTVRPAMLGPDNIMLMADKEIIGKYVDDPKHYVSTALSKEKYLAPCDIYRDSNIIFIDDMQVLDDLYVRLPLIGLDGDEHFKQDSLFAEKAWGHNWAKNSFLTKAVKFPNDGMGVVGAMRYYGTLEELETWIDTTINIDEPIPEPEPEPDDPPEPPHDPTLPAYGHDISTWQESPNIPGEIDFDKMRDNGASFLFIKGSQNRTMDNDFPKNWVGAKKAGLLRGAYHFADYRYPANLQAAYFYNLLKDDPGELPPVLDFELRAIWTTPYPSYCNIWINVFFDAWKALTDMPILFYCNPAMIRYLQPLPDWLTSHDLWIANYTTANEPQLYEWPVGWTFWQFTDRGDGLAAGVESKQIDCDYFYGTVGELMQYSVRTMGTEPAPELTHDQQHDLMWKDYQERTGM